MISCSLSPNTEADDVFLAFRLLFTPWKWKRGAAILRVESRLGGVSFNSGRAALFAILQSFGIGRGDEVIVQAFTCVAVPDAISWVGAAPVFADIDETYCMDPADFEKKITKKTKAIIVQHTFGISAQMEKISIIAKKHNIKVIEDFAHTMSLPLKGDAGFYSFGRDKVISSIFGGLAIGPVKSFQKTLEYPSYFWIFQQLLHPVAFAIILPTYSIGIGKIVLVILQKLHLLSFPQIHEVKKYPNALAILLLHQLKKLDKYTRQREEASVVYGKKYPYLRFPLRVDDPAKTIARAKKHGILLGNWYHNVVDPLPGTYDIDSCPRAQEAAKHIINLPTRISVKDARYVWKHLL